MSNLIMRLRSMPEGKHGSAPREAAEEIERLQALVDRLSNGDMRTLMPSMRRWMAEGGEA